MTGPTIIRLTVSKPTSTNRLRKIRHGHVASSKMYESWKVHAGKEIMAQRPKLTNRSLPLGPYAVAMLINVMDAGDIDNRMKAMIDLLCEMKITPDDKLLYDCRITRTGLVPMGSIVVVARSLTPLEVAACQAMTEAEADAFGTMIHKGGT